MRSAERRGGGEEGALAPPLFQADRDGAGTKLGGGFTVVAEGENVY